LAILDTHLPWSISGFRHSEFCQFVRERPNTVAFSLYRMAEPFPVHVHRLADFPAMAARLGITDVYLVFLNFALGVLGLSQTPAAARVQGMRSDISLASTLERRGIRSHVTIYPGGGLAPDVPDDILEAVGERTSTVFTSVPAVASIIPAARMVHVPLDTTFYGWTERPRSQVLRLVFCGDDRPRKGLRTLIGAYNAIGRGPVAERFHLDIVGPNEHYAAELQNPRFTLHGWLDPTRLREVFRSADVVVSPQTRDLPGEQGDTGVVDGFPTTAARSGMSTGCALVASNPLEDERIIKPDRDYVSVPERDVEALAAALIALAEDRDRVRELGRRGAARIRETCAADIVVKGKLRAMALT
jgi:glycosyltransferase involved in cell wall biosynthesis